jgi:uncharacterized protein YjbI with pentapeptide repeats
MDTKQALAMLRGGREGIAQWNERRRQGERPPDLCGADLSAVNLGGADLSHVNLSRARLNSAILVLANLTHAILSDADLMHANLERAELDGAFLSSAALRSAKLTRASLKRANLLDAQLNEAVLVNAVAAQAHLWGVNLTRADCTGADFEGCSMERAILVGTDLQDANLAGCGVYGASIWDLRGTPRDQSGLVIASPISGARITVDNLEVAQFIYLILNNEKIRDVIDTVGRKGVLILGRFSGGRKPILDAIRKELRKLDFLPMVFDFEKPTQRDFTETIKTLAGMSRFIIADITNPKSTPLELQATVPDYMVPLVPIIQEDEEPFAMFRDLQQKYGDWVLDVLRYDSAENLLQVLEPAVIQPALERSESLLLKKAEQIRERHVRDYIGRQ